MIRLLFTLRNVVLDTMYGLAKKHYTLALTSDLIRSQRSATCRSHTKNLGVVRNVWNEQEDHNRHRRTTKQPQNTD